MDYSATALVQALEAELGAGLVMSSDLTSRYGQDFTGDHCGNPLAVVRPETVQDVAKVLRWCQEHQVPLVPQGGNTGLVGGAIPAANGREIVLSMERMKRIRSLDMLNGVAVVEAGCVLSDFKAAVEAAGGFFPLSIGSEGSCQIGGTLSTNAGGVNVVRYGMARAQVAGIEVVLADGSVFSDLRGLRKDNTGYDLKQLFIGSEGTLGVVTAAALILLPQRSQTETLFVATASVAATVGLFRRVRDTAGDLITAFELMTGASVERVCATEPEVRNPLSGRYDSYAIIEISCSGGPPLRGWIEEMLAELIEEGLILDGTISLNGAQTDNIWGMRERIVESQARLGPYLRTDISVPIASVDDFIRAASARVEELVPGAQVLPYGHIGDGNIHFNVMRPETMTPADFVPKIHLIEEALFTLVDGMKGSISAEHGIGVAKRPAFADRLDPVARGLMIAVKQALDPANILSPGRVLPEEWL